MSQQAKNDGIAEYARIQMALQRQVEEGIIKPGEKLPADKDLAMAYGVSVGTVIKAVSNLVTAGFLNRVQGKGTFVNEIFMAPMSRRFFRLRPSFESEDVNFSMKLIEIYPLADLNAAFTNGGCFARNTPGYFMLRHMYVNGESLLYSAMLINGIICPNFDRLTTYDHEHRSMHWILREKYNLESRRREEFVRVGLPQDKDLAWFKLDKDKQSEPFLVMEAKDYLSAENPFFYHMMICNNRNYGMFREF